MSFPKPPEKIVPFNSGPVAPHDIGRQFDEHSRATARVIDFLKTVFRSDGVVKEAPSAANAASAALRRGGSKEPTLPVGALGPNAGGFYAGDDKGATATSADYAQVCIDWAEHMPDTIPPNTLAINAVTGDHWSSRWWANRSANAFGMMAWWYQGASAGPPPSTPNTPTGQPLPPGSMYFDTTLGTMQVWTGSIWVSSLAPGAATVASLYYAAAANQTVFPLSVADRNGHTFAFTQSSPEGLAAHVNGLRLETGFDFTVNTATSTVTFHTALSAGAQVIFDLYTPAAQGTGLYLPLAGGALTGPLIVPPTGDTQLSVAPTSMNVYAETGDSGHQVKSKFTSADPGPHASNDMAVLGVEHRPVGSGVNGPAIADFGLTVSSIKHNWSASPRQGEIDAINVVVRQGGPDAGGVESAGSDCSAILANVQNVFGTGYAVALEASVSNLNPGTSVIHKQMSAQLLPLDGVADAAAGMNITAIAGALNDAIVVQAVNGAAWAGVIQYTDNGVVKFSVDGAGNVDAASAAVTGGITVGAGLGVTGSTTFAGPVDVQSTGNISMAAGASGGNTSAVRFTNNAGALYAYEYVNTTNGVWQAVNVAASNSALQLNGDGSFQTTAATCYKPGGGSWTASSDIRIKTVVQEYKQGLSEVLQLRPVVYTYKGNDALTIGEPSPHAKAAADKTPFVGLIAQELEKVFPGMVSEREGVIDGEKVTDLKDVDVSALIYALVNAVRELSAKVTALEAKP